MPTETLAIPQQNAPGANAEIHALLHAAAIAPAAHLGFVRVTGEDRVRWLNGMTTNSIQALRPNEGCYTFFLNAQGRIQGDATAWLLEDAILLETPRERIPALIAHLDRFIIMDDVELAPVDDRAGLILAGPESAGVLKKHGFSHMIAAGPHLAEDRSRNLQLIGAYSPLVPRFELWADRTVIEALQAELAPALVPATPEALHQLRLLEGTPLYGTDIGDRDLPQETAQTRALHFAKGCYLGQEIVERIRSRGNVHRTLQGFTLTGDLPVTPAPLFHANAPERPIGELTSAARIHLPAGPIILALGIVRREALDAQAAIAYASGTALPTTLPYHVQKS